MPRGYELERVAARDERRLNVPKGARLVVLDERGRDFTTSQFAQLLAQPSAFVIGGADGVSGSLKDRAELLLRLSSLTLPHALAQVILVEQLYRAATLLTGHPYHRGG
jgi:23S rRNA (pseudouridine1915-N3)-methyltransferase